MRCNGSPRRPSRNPIAARRDQRCGMKIEDKPAGAPSFLSLLIEAMAVAGCALYPSSASVTLMVEIHAEQERRRRERLAAIALAKQRSC